MTGSGAGGARDRWISEVEPAGRSAVAWTSTIAVQRSELVEQVGREAGRAIAAVMNDAGWTGAGLAALEWRMDNLRLLHQDRCWPMQPQTAICGTPRRGADPDAATIATAWAGWLGLYKVPTARAAHLLEWVGDVGDAMSVRVWAWEAPEDEAARARPYSPQPVPAPGVAALVSQAVGQVGPRC